MMRTWRRRLALCAVLIVGGSRAASAHPHVWIDYDLTVMFEKGLVVALAQEWSFDEDFTASVLRDVAGEKKPAKTLSPADVAKIEKNAFSNLKNYGYFAHVFAGDEKVATREATGFKARLEGAKLVYNFTVPLEHGVDAKAAPTIVGVWDETYYVDVGPAEGKAPHLVGDGSAACQVAIITDHAHPIYFGAVFPKAVRVTC